MKIGMVLGFALAVVVGFSGPSWAFVFNTPSEHVFEHPFGSLFDTRLHGLGGGGRVAFDRGLSEGYLERSDIDAVTICVPSGLHAQVAIDALRAGKHVLVEKPIALNLADADRMIQVAREEKLTLGVVLQNRYNTPVQQVRQAIDRGQLGSLYLGNACVRWYRPQSYYEDDWHGTWAMDGGASD